jgi:predicted nucleic acid-binding protein
MLTIEIVFLLFYNICSANRKLILHSSSFHILFKKGSRKKFTLKLIKIIHSEKIILMEELPEKEQIKSILDKKKWKKVAYDLRDQTLEREAEEDGNILSNHRKILK